MKITRRQLRKIILEQMTAEAVVPIDALHNNSQSNPGSAFRAAAAAGELADSRRNKDRATKELTKTYRWFSGVVFPAVRENKWPIVADDDYYVQLDSMLGQLGVTRIIRKGTSWASVDARPTNFGGESTVNFPLEKLYEFLENSVINHDLDVPIESFP